MVGRVDADLQAPVRGVEEGLLVAAGSDGEVREHLTGLLQAGRPVVQTVVVGQGHGVHAALLQDLPVGRRAAEAVLLLGGGGVIRQRTLQVDEGEVVRCEEITDAGEGIGVVRAHHRGECPAVAPAVVLHAQGAVSGKAQEKFPVRPVGLWRGVGPFAFGGGDGLLDGKDLAGGLRRGIRGPAPPGQDNGGQGGAGEQEHGGD